MTDDTSLQSFRLLIEVSEPGRQSINTPHYCAAKMPPQNALRIIKANNISHYTYSTTVRALS